MLLLDRSVFQFWILRSTKKVIHMSASPRFAPASLTTSTFVEPIAPEADFLPLKGTDHVEFYTGNARQAALLLPHSLWHETRCLRRP